MTRDLALKVLKQAAKMFVARDLVGSAQEQAQAERFLIDAAHTFVEVDTKPTDSPSALPEDKR